MYNQVASASVAGAGLTSLAMTGANTFWMTVTAVALISSGLLIRRLVPKKEF